MEAILRREIIKDKLICRLLAAAAFTALTALGAYIRIPLPFTPVPLTLQTFFVLLAALMIGPRLASASQVAYIALGVMGLPLFTLSGSGWSYLCGPTTGYLFGFIGATVFIGRLSARAGQSHLRLFVLLCAAQLILLACGALWLKFITGVSWQKAFFMGFLPFLAGDILKAAAASAIYLRIRSRAREIF